MSITIYQTNGVGSTNPPSNITGIVTTGAPAGYGWVDHVSNASFDVGHIVILDGTTASDGYYSIVQEVSTTRTLVEPAPTAQGAGGTMSRNTWSTAKGGVDPVTNFLAGSQIQAPAATFITDGVQKNDRVVIENATTFTNSKSWFVDSVDSETLLTLRPLNGSAAMVVEAGAPGTTVNVRQGGHRIWCEDETSLTFAAILAGATVHATMGSGVPTDFITQIPITLSDVDLWIYEGLGVIDFYHTGATATAFVTENEIFANANRRTLASVMVRVAGPSPGVSTVVIGNRPAIDDKSARLGSAIASLEAIAPKDPNLIFYVYGSMLMKPETSNYSFPSTSVVRSSILTTTTVLPTLLSPPGGTMSRVTQYGQYPFTVLSSGFEGSDITNTYSTGQQWFGPNIGTVIIEGLGITDATFNPLWYVWSFSNPLPTLAIVLNPQEDYTTQELFTTATATRERGEIKFTWNPVFRERDANQVTGAPIEGLTIRIWDRCVSYFPWYWLYYVDPISFPWATDQLFGEFVTDVNGQINGGVGVDLIRGIRDKGIRDVDTVWVQRIEIEGIGYRYVNTVQTMTQKLDPVDFPVDVLATDFEEVEVST